jgi:nitrite reductase (NO-forming)
MKTKNIWLFFLLVFASMIAAGCKPQPAGAQPAVGSSTRSVEVSPQAGPGGSTSSNLEFNLQTSLVGGRMVYVGVGGDIEGVVNPDLIVPGDVTVRVNLSNGDGIPHDLSFPDFNATSALVTSMGKTTTMSFDVKADQIGTYAYFCTQPGHRQAGQEGQLIVSEPE